MQSSNFATLHGFTILRLSHEIIKHLISTSLACLYKTWRLLKTKNHTSFSHTKNITSYGNSEKQAQDTSFEDWLTLIGLHSSRDPPHRLVWILEQYVEGMATLFDSARAWNWWRGVTYRVSESYRFFVEVRVKNFLPAVSLGWEWVKRFWQTNPYKLHNRIMHLQTAKISFTSTAG